MSMNDAAQKLRDARAALLHATRATRTEALRLLATGMTEVDVAKTLGVNRLTIRKWAGK